MSKIMTKTLLIKTKKMTQLLRMRLNLIRDCLNSMNTLWTLG